MAKSKQAIPTWKLYNRPWYLKLLFGIGNYFKGVGLMIWGVIKAIPFKIWALLLAIGHCFQGLWNRFVKGDWRTKMSYLIMGFGNFSRGPKQFLVGFLYLAVEAVYVLILIFGGGPYLLKFGSLGTKVEYMDYSGDFPVKVDGDNSLKILIFSVFTIMLTIFFVVMYISNTKSAYKAQQTVAAGKPLSTFKQQINYALNDGYHTTILALPIFGVLIITVLPLISNILIAFTNYNYLHKPTASLFTWTGFDAFGEMFGQEFGSLLWRTLGWTLIWAFFATFTNFFFGMFLAMMINKKSIKMKVFWRTCFVIVIAVPDFVTLMLMSQFFSFGANTATYTGAFNHIIHEWFHIKTENAGGVNWLGGEIWMARMMVIIINLWRGMPFTMLATMGILMNIPAEMYESSRIDGAGPVRRFISITFPYIMFVMGPQLITTFTGNINNFNVIFFLTGGGPFKMGGYGGTQLLITWLYKITMQDTSSARYNIGSVIGIFTFIISAVLALIVFNSSKSNKQEDTFQ
ncbi:MAG: sugar ABC transporter permease [Clostridiales bacterium]|nr:sugar ABC transporter permease [Clostridiales bacterium]